MILFAPTYRGKNRKTAYYPYHMINFQRLYDFCGEEYVVLFKMHPWVSEAVPIEEAHKDRFVDANKYPNINDLFYITEILITDYSSNIFEYSLMRKPMLFFAFDKINILFQEGSIVIMRKRHRVRSAIPLHRSWMHSNKRIMNMKKLNNM